MDLSCARVSRVVSPNEIGAGWSPHRDTAYLEPDQLTRQILLLSLQQLEFSIPTYAENVATRLADYIDAGHALDSDECDIAALALQEDTVPESDELDASWQAELRRRLTDIETGHARFLDYDESHMRLRSELAAGHP